MNATPKKTGRVKKILRIAALALCGLIIGLQVYSANARRLVGNQMPMPFGYGSAVVMSGSMEPEMSKGDMIIVKKADTFEKDQVVVYQDGNSLVVHRIIEMGDGTVITKGDANNVADQPVATSQIKGRVVCTIPFVGNIFTFIKTPIGTILTIVLAVLLLELPRLREKQKDMEELEKIKAEIRQLKDENNQ